MWVTQLLVITTTIFMRIGYGTTFIFLPLTTYFALGIKMIIKGNLEL